MKNYSEFISENNLSDKDIIKECFIDFLSTSWVLTSIRELYIRGEFKRLYYLEDNEIYQRKYRDFLIAYSGYVVDEKITVKSTITKNEINHYIENLHEAVLRINQMINDKVSFTLYSFNNNSNNIDNIDNVKEMKLGIDITLT